MNPYPLRRLTAIIVLLCVSIMFSMAALSWALYERFTETNRKRNLQATLNAEFCREIEKLKQARREQAQAGYENRQKDFALLGIPLTVALEDRLAENLRTTLERFRAEPCPRPPRENGT